MKKIFLIYFAVVFCFIAPRISAQIPVKTLVQISRAEDELRFDKTLADLMKSGDASIRARVALAAGRIGKEDAIAALIDLLEKDSDADVRQTAAFALGEIESTNGANAILKVLQNTEETETIRARAVEAAGKIAAANAKDEKSKSLGAAILDVLRFEETRATKQNRSIVLLGITAVLRAKPEGGDAVAARFLTNADARVRADAANTLSRLRSKISNEKLRAMLRSDKDAVARANAARALGAAEDKDAFDILLASSISDADSRVRVSAIRSLGALKNAKAADKLIERGEKLFSVYKNRKLANPAEKNELLEIIAALGRLLPNSNDKKLFNFLKDVRRADEAASPETEIAFARIFPKYYSSAAASNTDQLKLLLIPTIKVFSWQSAASVAQGLSEIANIENEQKDLFRKDAAGSLRFILNGIESAEFERLKKTATPIKFRKEIILAARAVPDILRAYAQFKAEDLPQILREHLKHEDVIVRATAVELLGELPAEKIQFGDFEESFRRALEDEKLNDALLATIEAIGKQKTERATDFLKDRLLFLAKMNPKYGLSKFMARRRIIALLKEKSAGDFADKLGKPDSIFTPPDYVRAVSRKNARAVLTTEKGIFTIEFFPEDAPLTVDNFIKLARAKYFNGLTIHRVVPNFVMQDGDPRGDGNGGPGWEIRDEINAKPFERGTVGMALSGKDTGGSQWFVCHSPQPHLDGGYTVFGRVSETGMKVVDNLARGDKILSVKIIEEN